MCCEFWAWSYVSIPQGSLKKMSPRIVMWSDVKRFVHRIHLLNSLQTRLKLSLGNPVVCISDRKSPHAKCMLFFKTHQRETHRRWEKILRLKKMLYNFAHFCDILWFWYFFWFQYDISMILIPFLISMLYCCDFATFLVSILYFCDFATFSDFNMILLWFCYLFWFQSEISVSVILLPFLISKWNFCFCDFAAFSFFNIILLWFCYLFLFQILYILYIFQKR